MKLLIEIDSPSLELIADELTKIASNAANNEFHCTSDKFINTRICTDGYLAPFLVARWDNEGENIIKKIEYCYTEKECNELLDLFKNDENVDVCDITVNYSIKY